MSMQNDKLIYQFLFDIPVAKYYSKLNYKDNWDILFKAIHKIEKLSVKGKEILYEGAEAEDVMYSFSVRIEYMQCTINRDMLPQYYGTEEDFLHLYDCRNKSKEAATYKAIVTFIKWYNKQQN